MTQSPEPLFSKSHASPLDGRLAVCSARGVSTYVHSVVSLGRSDRSTPAAISSSVPAMPGISFGRCSLSRFAFSVSERACAVEFSQIPPCSTHSASPKTMRIMPCVDLNRLNRPSLEPDTSILRRSLEPTIRRHPNAREGIL